MTLKLGREIVRTCCAGVAVHLVVVTACSAGGGGHGERLTAEPGHQLDAAQASVTDELGEEQAAPDAGKPLPTLPVPVTEAKANESGSRLKARWYAGADGSRQFVNWYDTELGTECYFQDIGDGVLRCLPSVTASVHYTDSACSRLLFSDITSPCGETPMTIGAVPVKIGGACAPQYKYYRPSAKTVPTQVFALSGTDCVAQPADPGLTYWTAGAAMPIASFATADIVTE